MAFLNKKEDVIDFQLTQYGKYLLSKGRFKPTYYAFFDDDIIYDQRYASGSSLEVQNEIEDRILKNSVSLDTQYLFHSVDNLGMQDQFSRSNNEAEKAKWDWHQVHRNKLEQTSEKHYALTNPLSNSDITNDKAPAFNVFFHDGEINNVEMLISGSVGEEFSMKKIPQINLKDVRFFISVAHGPSAGPEYIFPDGTYLRVNKGQVHFEVKEENTILEKDGFEVEVYALDNNNRIENQLYFEKEPEDLLEGGILLDAPVGASRPSYIRNPGDAEYFFDILSDEELE